jgi:hypothetical protein
MDKKVNVHLTNEDLTGKFKSNFELVNYAIKLAENMIRTGRDARVKSDIQNRAMLILEEIEEGKDQFDEVKVTSSEFDLDGVIPPGIISEERLEKRKYRTSDSSAKEE